MANVVYPKFLEALWSQPSDSNASTGTVKAALVDTGTYTYSAAHDFYDDVSTAVVGTPETIGSKTFTNGYFDGADVTFTAVSGSTAEAIVVYIDTGTASTSRLIAYIDTATFESLTHEMFNDWWTDTGTPVFMVKITNFHANAPTIRASQDAVAASNTYVVGIADGGGAYSGDVHYLTATQINAVADAIYPEFVSAFYTQQLSITPVLIDSGSQASRLLWRSQGRKTSLFLWSTAGPLCLNPTFQIPC